MNPAIIFKHDGQAIILRVKTAAVKAHVGDVKAFRGLLRQIGDAIDYDEDNKGHDFLPIGDELSGRWRLSSPCGQEGTTPPVGWEFEARMKTALKSKIHSLAIFPHVVDYAKERALIKLHGKEKALQVATDEAKKVVETILGAGAVVEVEAQKVRHYLDDALEGWGSDNWTDGGTC